MAEEHSKAFPPWQGYTQTQHTHTHTHTHTHAHAHTHTQIHRHRHRHTNKVTHKLIMLLSRSSSCTRCETFQNLRRNVRRLISTTVARPILTTESRRGLNQTRCDTRRTNAHTQKLEEELAQLLQHCWRLVANRCW